MLKIFRSEARPTFSSTFNGDTVSIIYVVDYRNGIYLEQSLGFFFDAAVAPNVLRF